MADGGGTNCEEMPYNRHTQYNDSHNPVAMLPPLVALFQPN